MDFKFTSRELDDDSLEVETLSLIFKKGAEKHFAGTSQDITKFHYDGTMVNFERRTAELILSGSFALNAETHFNIKVTELNDEIGYPVHTSKIVYTDDLILIEYEIIDGPSKKGRQIKLERCL